MPKPHYPVGGGRHLPAWQRAASRTPRSLVLPPSSVSPVHQGAGPASAARQIGAATPPAGANGRQATLPATSGAGQAARPTSPPLKTTPVSASSFAVFTSPRSLSRQMVAWVAALVCLAALLFAIAAVAHHG